MAYMSFFGVAKLSKNFPTRKNKESPKKFNLIRLPKHLPKREIACIDNINRLRSGASRIARLCVGKKSKPIRVYMANREYAACVVDSNHPPPKKLFAG